MKQYVFALFVLATLTLCGQNLRLKNLTVNSGLSHSDVRSITTDENGLIWLATNSGLNRFDGYDLNVFKKDLSDPKSLPGNRISKVISNKSGFLYMLTEKQYAISYDMDMVEFRYIQDEHGKTYVFEELFSLNNERFFLRTYSNQFLEITRDKEIKLQKLFTLDSDIQIESSHFLNGKYYFLSKSKELFCYSKELDTLERINSLNEPVLGWSNSNNHSILYCTTEGIYSLSNNEIKQLVNEPFDESTDVTDIVEGPNGEIWVALYAGGVFRFSNDRGVISVDRYNEKNVLATNRINDLFIDDFNELWIATSGAGVYHASLSSKPFYEINKQAGYGLLDNYVTAIHNEGDDLWVGTRKGLALISNYKNNTVETSTVLKNRHITKIFRDGSGSMLLGTRFNGLFLNDGENFKKIESLSSNEISGIAQDSMDRIWVSTFDQGVIVFDHLDLNQQQVADSILQDLGITYLYMDQHRPIVWLGTFDNGLIEIDISDANSFKVTKHQHDKDDSKSISSNYIWPINQTANGDLWVGTIGGGLNLLHRKLEGQDYFEYFTVNDGLPDNDIESIVIDSKDKIWLGGRGLSVFDPTTKEVLNNYNFEDGLQSNSFKIGAATRGDNGRLFFGGINGLNYFLPEKIAPDTIQPILFFDQLSILNKPIQVGQVLNDRVVLETHLNKASQIVFDATHNEFTISVLAVHHSNPDKNSYAYKLEGYNDEWVEVSSNDRGITFANLKQGSYLFQAKVSNGDGLWSKVREMEFVILSPWYLTWWALLGYLIFMLLLLVSYRYLIIRQAHLQQNLNDSEDENQKNEDRLTLFTNISHEIRTPLTLIKGPLQVIIDKESLDGGSQSELLIINKNVDRLLRLTNQLLDFRRYESGHVELKAAEGNIVRFLNEICLLFGPELNRKKIKLNFNSDSEELTLAYDRDKMEIVVANLISNALKFTPEEGEITVTIKKYGDDNEPAVYEKGKLKSNFIQMTISDTGSGINPKDAEKVFDRFYQAGSLNQLDIRGTGIGLALVKNIVLQHKGEIALKSSKGKGSNFIIRMPFGKGHLDANQLMDEFKDSESLEAYREVFEEEIQAVDINIPEKPDLQKPLILVVEDNMELAHFIQKCLKSRFRTKHAKNGKIGLELAEEKLPDLILSDVMMPEMDGISMLKQIRENSNISFIPVILLTARTSSIYEVQGIQTGAQDYITKPFNPKVLIAKINSIMELRIKYKAHYLKTLKQEASNIELPNKEYQFLDSLRNMVLDNLTNETFSVAVLTKMAGMSKSAFYKRVKELTDRTAVQFIRDVRLKKASELIGEGDFSISQVAYTVGINDQKFFRDKFKELFGVNPSEYRARAKEGK